jgi:hypothetical protein
MKENEPLIIRAVENGFIVTPEVGMHEVMLDSSRVVFRAMAELCAFIASHYTHRAAVDLNDHPTK